MNGVQGVEGSNPFIPTRDLKGIHGNMDSLFSFLRIGNHDIRKFYFSERFQRALSDSMFEIYKKLNIFRVNFAWHESKSLLFTTNILIKL